MLGKVALLLFFAATAAFGYRRLLAYLRYFQQEEYNEKRFRTWLSEKKAVDSRGTIVGLAVAASAILIPTNVWTMLSAVVGGTALSVVGYLVEGDPRSTGKITLKVTERARKIHSLSFLLYSCALIAVFVLAWCVSPSCCSHRSAQGIHAACALGDTGWRGIVILAIASTLLARFTPEFLILANRILAPAEKRLQQFFIDDAKRILREVDPYIIGITGSYGKTGAKAALGELLPQCVGPTFWPKKSINTVMGITRDIREHLLPHYEYAVIEMGAYGIGSIKKLCALTPPHAAIVTAVGIMHLERFGSEENVFRAKSELPEAIPSDGILVCNGDNDGARRMAESRGSGVSLLYGLDASKGRLDCYGAEVSFSTAGTKCTIHWKGMTIPASTPLLGRPALSNALAAFTMACALGAEPHFAAAALSTLQPVDNRLVLERKGPVSFIRDAYNSNPTGFAAALEILKVIEAKRRILVTPGMVELGERQEEENRKIGVLAASIVDHVLVVSPVNRVALLKGLKEGGLSDEKIKICDTRSDAFTCLSQMEQAGDLVLIENDLGDLLEGSVTF